MSRGKHQSFWQRILNASSLTLCLVCSVTVLAGGGPPAVVQVENAVNMEIAPTVWVTGTVIGRNDAKIAAEVEGRLEKVLDVGDVVEQGGLIARVDAKKYQLVVEEIQAEINPIEVMVNFYSKEVARLQSLAEKNNAAKNQLDETTANRDEALARIQQTRTKLAVARDDLDKTRILAPFTGVVTERLKTPGERVEAGDEVLRLVDTEQLEIRAFIQHESFINLKKGDQVKIDGPNGIEVATVRALIPVGDADSRLYEVRLVSETASWSAGIAVKIAAPIAAKQTVLAVPRDALVIRQAGIIVYKITDDNVAALVPVTTGIANTNYIQVNGDIKADDRIVIRGNERLRPGQQVNITSGF